MKLKDYRDLVLKRALGVQAIEDGYFEREMKENLQEQGFEVEVEELVYGDIERIIRRSYKLIEELEQNRTNKPLPPYDGGDIDGIYGDLVPKRTLDLSK